MARPRKHRPPLDWHSLERTKVVQQAELAFIQMRMVRDGGARLIQDTDRFEVLLSDLRKAVEEREEPRPQRVEPPPGLQPRVLRIRDVAKRIGLSRGTIYKLQQRGEFPQSIPLTVGSVGWKTEDVDAWLAARGRTNDR